MAAVALTEGAAVALTEGAAVALTEWAAAGAAVGAAGGGVRGTAGFGAADAKGAEGMPTGAMPEETEGELIGTAPAGTDATFGDAAPGAVGIAAAEGFAVAGAAAGLPCPVNARSNRCAGSAGAARATTGSGNRCGARTAAFATSPVTPAGRGCWTPASYWPASSVCAKNVRRTKQARKQPAKYATSIIGNICINIEFISVFPCPRNFRQSTVSVLLPTASIPTDETAECEGEHYPPDELDKKIVH